MSTSVQPVNTLPRPNVALLPLLNNGTNHVNATTLIKSSATINPNASINVLLVGQLVLLSVALLDLPRNMDNVWYVILHHQRLPE